ncbi:hypothetical protein ACLRE7_01240 [Mycoplasmopsis meleagridis]|uniref:hypothetical protein n=1 Tax=Mycoplasmopsis meleagridis TaxID=29561 RepID=UPI003A877071
MKKKLLLPLLSSLGTITTIMPLALVASCNETNTTGKNNTTSGDNTGAENNTAKVENPSSENNNPTTSNDSQNPQPSEETQTNQALQEQKNSTTTVVTSAKALEAKLEKYTLTDSKDKVSALVNELEAELAKAEPSIEVLKTKTDTLSAEIASANTSVSEIDKKLTTLETNGQKLSTLKTSALTDEKVKTLATKVEAAVNEVNSFKEKEKFTSQELDALNAKVITEYNSVIYDESYYTVGEDATSKFKFPAETTITKESLIEHVKANKSAEELKKPYIYVYDRFSKAIVEFKDRVNWKDKTQVAILSLSDESLLEKNKQLISPSDPLGNKGNLSNFVDLDISKDNSKLLVRFKLGTYPKTVDPKDYHISFDLNNFKPATSTSTSGTQSANSSASVASQETSTGTQSSSATQGDSNTHSDSSSSSSSSSSSTPASAEKSQTSPAAASNSGAQTQK